MLNTRANMHEVAVVFPKCRSFIWNNFPRFRLTQIRIHWLPLLHQLMSGEQGNHAQGTWKWGSWKIFEAYLEYGGLVSGKQTDRFWRWHASWNTVIKFWWNETGQLKVFCGLLVKVPKKDDLTALVEAGTRVAVRQGLHDVVCRRQDFRSRKPPHMQNEHVTQLGTAILVLVCASVSYGAQKKTKLFLQCMHLVRKKLVWILSGS